MSNKTDIEEDIKILKAYVKDFNERNKYCVAFREDLLKIAIENILADRERLEKDKQIQEDNYHILSEDVSSIAKELNLEEDAIIDEIYTAIRILKSKRINMFEQLDCIAKANKYDSLVEKIKEVIEKNTYKDTYNFKTIEVSVLQELLDAEK